MQRQLRWNASNVNETAASESACGLGSSHPRRVGRESKRVKAWRAERSAQKAASGTVLALGMAFAAVSLVTWNNLFGDTPRSFLEHPSFVHHADTTTIQINHNRPIAAGMGGMQWGQWLSEQSSSLLSNAQKNQDGDVAIAGLIIDHERPVDRCMGRDLSMAIGQTHLALATQMADWGIHLGLSERVDVPEWQQLATPQNRHLMQPQSTTQLHAHLVHREPLGLVADDNPQPTGVLVVAVDNGIVSSLCYLPKK